MENMIYLASQSPRRQELLRQIGVRHQLLAADADDDVEALEAVHGREAPASYVRRVASLKLEAAMARRVGRSLPEAPVLCADTTVALGREIFGKPRNAQEAGRMLKRLSGATHRVLTAVALGLRERRLYAISVSQVTFSKLSLAELKAYANSDEPMGKAGAYAIQGRSSMFVSHIRGSYSGIMGLPLFETVQLLKLLGLKP